MDFVAITLISIWSGIALVLVVWLARSFWQMVADRMHTTFELSFPRGMTHAQVLDFVRSALGELPRPQFLRPVYSLVFEKYADVNGKKYYLHIPGHVKAKIDKLLDKKIEGISIDVIKPDDDLVRRHSWPAALEITMSGSHAPLRIASPEAVAASIDANFDGLDQGEALVLQWVIFPDRPRGPHEGDKEKVGDYTLHAIARIGAVGEDAQQMLANLAGSIRSVNSHGSVLKRRILPGVSDRINRRAGTTAYPIFLNANEFTALMGWQLDGSGNFKARALPAAAIHSTGDVRLGFSNHHKSRGQIISMPHEAGDMHMSLIGGSGTGKSVLLENIFLEKARDKQTAMFLLEPAGDLALDVLNRIPAERVDDVIYLDPLDTAWPIGLNPLVGSDAERTTSHVVSVFHQKFQDTWSAQMERVMTAAVATAAHLGLTLYDVRQLLVNREYRQAQLRRLPRASFPDIHQEWSWMDEKHDAVVDSSVNRVQSFLSSSMVRNILAQKQGLDFDWIIREHKILLVPLPAARMGPINAAILGSLIREMAWNAAMKQPPGSRNRSVVLLDEWQNFADISTSKSDPLSEARKYQQQYILANQYTDQLPLAVQHTMFKNVATQMVFRLDPDDAKRVKDRYAPLGEVDIANLPRFHVAARIMTGEGMAPIVTFRTPPPPAPTHFARRIIDNTRSRYATPVATVTKEIMERHKTAEPKRRPRIGWEDE